MSIQIGTTIARNSLGPTVQEEYIRHFVKCQGIFGTSKGRHCQTKIRREIKHTSMHTRNTMAVGLDHTDNERQQKRSSQPTFTWPPDMDALRFQLSSLVARWQSRVSLDTLRPLPVFLGVNNNNSNSNSSIAAGICLAAGAFTPPIQKMDKSSLEKIATRVRLNSTYFVSNYALVAAMTAIVVALMHPSMLVFLALVYALWAAHRYMIRHPVVVFGVPLHTLVSVQQRWYALVLVTTLVVVGTCLVPALIFSTITGVLILSHAVLRDPKHIDSSSAAAHDDCMEDDYDAEEGGTARGGGHDSGESSGSEVMVERPLLGVRGDVI
jgi:hypothetical protein